jgi:hypothetical protein
MKGFDNGGSCGAAGGRNEKKIKNQKAKIKNEEPLRGDFFAVFSAGRTH